MIARSEAPPAAAGDTAKSDESEADTARNKVIGCEVEDCGVEVVDTKRFVVPNVTSNNTKSPTTPTTGSVVERSPTTCEPTKAVWGIKTGHGAVNGAVLDAVFVVSNQRHKQTR
jgi:hypothetical protein